MNTPLPCPFCGYVGLQFREGSTFRWLYSECGECGATCGETRVQTMGNGTRDEWLAQAEKDAIEVWNKRAAQPDCRTCTQHVVSCWSNIKCVNGDKYIEAPKVVLWRTE